MLPRLTIHAAALFVAIAVLVSGGYANADKLPEGISATVIAEYPSKIPAIEKVRLVKILIKPGAKFDNIEVKSEEYCELKKGQLTHVSHDTGVVDLYTVGSRWSPPKGSYHTVTNTGNVDAEMWVYQLVERGAKDADKM